MRRKVRDRSRYRTHEGTALPNRCSPYCAVLCSVCQQRIFLTVWRAMLCIVPESLPVPEGADTPAFWAAIADVKVRLGRRLGHIRACVDVCISHGLCWCWQRILDGSKALEVHLDFLFRHNNTDPLLLLTLKAASEGNASADSRSSVLHNAAVAAHAFMSCGAFPQQPRRPHEAGCFRALVRLADGVHGMWCVVWMGYLCRHGRGRVPSRQHVVAWKGYRVGALLGGGFAGRGTQGQPQQLARSAGSVPAVAGPRSAVPRGWLPVRPRPHPRCQGVS